MAAGTPEALWTSYLEAYGPVSAEQRETLLAASVDDGVVFTNPGGGGSSRQGLISHIEDFQRKLPGAYFKTDKVLHNHAGLLAVWSMHKADDAKVATGYNFVQLAPDGRFKFMAGFF